jgi:hypothetical protein
MCVVCHVWCLLFFCLQLFLSSHPLSYVAEWQKKQPKKDTQPSYKLHGDSPVYMGPVAFGKLVKGAIAGK